MTKEAIAKEPSGRTRRTPVSRKNILTVQGKDPNYHYRIVNDVGDRVQSFIDAGYELVPDDKVRVGDKRINKTSSEGSISHLSVGQGDKAFVMKIKKEWFDEDQATKQAEVNRMEETARQTALDGTYGKLEISRG